MVFAFCWNSNSPPPNKLGVFAPGADIIWIPPDVKSNENEFKLGTVYCMSLFFQVWPLHKYHPSYCVFAIPLPTTISICSGSTVASIAWVCVKLLISI